MLVINKLYSLELLQMSKQIENKIDRLSLKHFSEVYSTFLDQLLCIGASFWVLRTPESWFKYLIFGHLQDFFFFITIFTFFVRNEEKYAKTVF